MARRSAKDWARLVSQWKRSGLTAAEFGRQVGINPRTLSWWKWRLGSQVRSGPAKKRSASRAPKSMALVAVQVVGSSEAPETPVEVVLGEAVVRVRRGFDEQTLSRVLGVLEEEGEGC